MAGYEQYQLRGVTVNTQLFSLDIRDIQTAMRENQAMIQKLRTGSGFRRALAFALPAAHRYTVSITHVETGALRASHRMGYLGATRAEIYIDPGAVGPHGPPAHYGPYEHARGGSHAYYDRTIREAGPRIADQALNIAAKDLGL